MMRVCIQFAYIYVEWIIYSQDAFLLSSWLACFSGVFFLLLFFSFREIESLIICTMKRTNNSEKAVESLPPPFQRRSLLCKIPWLLPVLSEILDGCGFAMIKIAAACCVPGKLLYLLFCISYSTRQPREVDVTSSLHTGNGLRGQHDLPQAPPPGSGRGGSHTCGCPPPSPVC